MNSVENPDLFNVGTGTDIPILDLALLIKEIIGYKGVIQHDLSKPDGTPRKLLDLESYETKTGNLKFNSKKVSKVYIKN